MSASTGLVTIDALHSEAQRCGNRKSFLSLAESRFCFRAGAVVGHVLVSYNESTACGVGCVGMQLGPRMVFRGGCFTLYQMPYEFRVAWPRAGQT